jgi:hypothetical protein
MGIRFSCPSGHKLNVKSFLAGKRAICPQCGAKVIVPDVSESSADAISRQDDGAYSMAGGSQFGPGPETASSVVIDVMESRATSPAVADRFAATIPESIVAVTSPTAAVVEPTAAATPIDLELRRARSRRNQMVAAVFLFIVVIVLAGVFVWVLHREAASMKAQETPPAEKTSSVEQSSHIVLDTRRRVFAAQTSKV